MADIGQKEGMYKIREIFMDDPAHRRIGIMEKLYTKYNILITRKDKRIIKKNIKPNNINLKIKNVPESTFNSWLKKFIDQKILIRNNEDFNYPVYRINTKQGKNAALQKYKSRDGTYLSEEIRQDSTNHFLQKNINNHRQNSRIILNRDHLNCFKLGMNLIISAISIYKGINDDKDSFDEDVNCLKKFCELTHWTENDYILIQKAIGITEPFTFDLPKNITSIQSEVLEKWVNIKKYLNFLKGDEYSEIFEYGFSIGLFFLNFHTTNNEEVYKMVIDGIEKYGKQFGIDEEKTMEFLKNIEIEGALDYFVLQSEIIIPYYLSILVSIEKNIKN